MDTPRGDLNHNGALDQGGYTTVQWSNVQEYEVFPTDASIYAAANNEAHFYAECSGKGACQRDTGICQCYPGYTGAACQRCECGDGAVMVRCSRAQLATPHDDRRHRPRLPTPPLQRAAPTTAPATACAARCARSPRGP